MAIATNFGNVVIYLEGLLPIKSLGSWVTSSCEITQQIKNISPLPQCLCPPNLAGGDLSCGTPYNNLTWPFEHDKLKLSNFSHHNAYGHQTCECGGISLITPTQKVIWSFSHVVLWDHVTKWKRYISICRCSNPNSTLVTWQIDKIISLLPQDL